MRALAVVLPLVLLLGVTACGPADPLDKVRELQAAGDYQGSLEPLRELLAARPDDAEVEYLRGHALARIGQPSLAQWSLRRAMEDPQWLVPAGLELAGGALETEDITTALETLGRVLEAEPENRDALLMLANAHASSPSKEDKEQALADVERILELDPDSAAALQPRIVALLGLERPDEAAEAIRELGDRIEKTEPEPGVQAWYCATTALFAEENGDLEQARERWGECLERYPAHRNVVQNAVQFYDARGESDRSLEVLRKALDEAPASTDYRTVLAQRLRASGDIEGAEALLREPTASPNPAVATFAWLQLSEHYQELADYGASARAAEQAWALAQRAQLSQPQLLLEVADPFVLAGELDRALAVTEEMTVAAHRELIQARVFQKRGEPEKALEHFDEAFRLWPNNAAARYTAALAAEELGDFDRAIEAYRYAIRIAPGATYARQRLAQLRLAEGKPERALQVLRSRVDRAPLDLEGELLSLHLWGRLGETARLQRGLAVFRLRAPDQLGRALASAAEGVQERGGATAAVELLRATQEVDLGDPRNADALRALVRFSHEAGVRNEAESVLAEALRAHPEAGALYEIRGLTLELGGAPDSEVREAYARALELEPDNARALAGLARLALPRDPERAFLLFEKAADSDPRDASLKRGAAEALVAAGRAGDAEKLLEGVLAQDPYDGAAAAQLAELQLARGVATDRTLELAQRAVRFGGGPDAQELLSRIHRERNEPERATEAAGRARALRRGEPGA